MCTHIITISGEKLDELGKLLYHKHNINFSTKFSIYEKAPFTGADISESNDSKDKLRQQAKDILDKIQSHQEEEESIPEWMEGFEDLVYSGYELQYGDYLILNKLSTPQILFLKNTIASSSSAFETEIRDYVKWTFVSGLIGYKGSKPRGAKEIFFNDLFITKQ